MYVELLVCSRWSSDRHRPKTVQNYHFHKKGKGASYILYTFVIWKYMNLGRVEGFQSLVIQTPQTKRRGEQCNKMVLGISQAISRLCLRLGNTQAILQHQSPDLVVHMPFYIPPMFDCFSDTILNICFVTRTRLLCIFSVSAHLLKVSGNHFPKPLRKKKSVNQKTGQP